MWVSLSSSYLQFPELLNCLYSCLPTNLRRFQPLFLQIVSLHLSFSSSVCSFHSMHASLSLDGGHMPLRLFSPFIYLLSSIISIILSSSSLIYSSICSNHLQIPLVMFSIPTIILFSSIISFWFLSQFLYWYFHFIHMSLSWLSPHLPLVLWASLRQLF